MTSFVSVLAAFISLCGFSFQCVPDSRGLSLRKQHDHLEHTHRASGILCPPFDDLLWAILETSEMPTYLTLECTDPEAILIYEDKQMTPTCASSPQSTFHWGPHPQTLRARVGKCWFIFHGPCSQLPASKCFAYQPQPSLALSPERTHGSQWLSCVIGDKLLLTLWTTMISSPLTF